VRLKLDGTRWRTGGEVKGKLANGVGIYYLGTWLLTLMRASRLPAVDWTYPTADLNGLVRFGERRNLVSARVPSRFKCTLPTCTSLNSPSLFLARIDQLWGLAYVQQRLWIYLTERISSNFRIRLITWFLTSLGYPRQYHVILFYTLFICL